MLNDLLDKVKNRIPNFYRLKVIPKEAVSKLKCSGGDLVVKLKNKRLYKISLTLGNYDKVRSFFRLTKW